MAFRDEDFTTTLRRPARSEPETALRAPEAERSPAMEPVAEAPPQADSAEPVPPKKGSRRRPIILVLAAIAALVGAYYGYGWWTTGRFMVSTDDAYVQADITVLAAKVPGYVSSVEVVNNQSVKAGDVIARIDEGDYRNAVEAAKGRIATQQSTVQRIGRQIEAARAAVDQAAPQIVAAQADAVRAAADLQRQTRLSQSDYTSQARLEQAKADNDRAQANVKAMQAALAAANANVAVLQAQRVEAERGIAELKTALERAERDLSFTVIRAPLDGVVGNKAVEVGSFVQPGTRLAALVPLSSVHVDANFKETQLASIRPGQRAHIEVDAFPGRDFPAWVESLAPASGAQFSLLPPENATGNFTKIVQRVPVRIALDPAVAAEGLLRPGLSVVVRVDSRDRPVEHAAAR